MVVIGEAIIENRLIHERFACDLVKCKGACCSLPGGRGAPLDDGETLELERVLTFAKKYLSPRHLQILEQRGASEGEEGSRATTCVDDKDCIFVYHDAGISRCSIERAYLEGETAWRKPISCHLFPVRITPGNNVHLRYEHLPECSSALERGREEDIPLHEFLKDSLIRKFGQEWYDEFLRICKSREIFVCDENIFGTQNL